jgi:sulfite oxidase
MLKPLLLDFQSDPLPKTNPILIGHRWKEYHEALGLKSIVDFSWEMVQKEKEDMLHVLDFPYNGETLPKYILGDGKITQNKHHLCVCGAISTLVFSLRT